MSRLRGNFIGDALALIGDEAEAAMSRPFRRHLGDVHVHQPPELAEICPEMLLIHAVRDPNKELGARLALLMMVLRRHSVQVRTVAWRWRCVPAGLD